MFCLSFVDNSKYFFIFYNKNPFVVYGLLGNIDASIPIASIFPVAHKRAFWNNRIDFSKDHLGKVCK
jgi:hypothetical protein